MSFNDKSCVTWRHKCKTYKIPFYVILEYASLLLTVWFSVFIAPWTSWCVAHEVRIIITVKGYFICIVASAIIIWFLYHREYGAEEPCVRLVVNKPWFLLYCTCKLKLKCLIQSQKMKAFVIVAGQNRVLGLLRYSQIIKQCVPVLQSLNSP